MAEQEQDRSEQATPFKLKEARRRGSVARSPDVVSCAVLAAAVGWLYAQGWSFAQLQMGLDQFVFRHAGSLAFGPEATLAWLQALLVRCLAGLAPVLAVVAIAAIAANLAQSGVVFSGKPIAPDFSRLDPANGLKRVFSTRTLYDAARCLLKLLLLGGVLALSLVHTVPWLLATSSVEPAATARPLLDELAALLFRLVLAMLVIALVDLLYTRWEYAQRMRMSRRELRDEVKQREGDPRIRARLRQLRTEMLRKTRAMRKLPGADVVVANPTHLAVALRYRRGEDAAPLVIAKGAGKLALRMRQVAARYAIPVVENRPLARELYHRVETDQPVPEAHYAEVARILVWVFAMRDARAAGAT